MSPLITCILLFFLGLYGLTILVEFIIYRTAQSAVEASLLISAVIILNNFTGFPSPEQSFGGTSPVVSIGLMFICIILGMVAQYFFFRSVSFSLRSFLKPFYVSPFILLPLIGSAGTSNLETIQVISLCLLSFQNGFFWKVIFDRAKKHI